MIRVTNLDNGYVIRLIWFPVLWMQGDCDDGKYFFICFWSVESELTNRNIKHWSCFSILIWNTLVLFAIPTKRCEPLQLHI